MPIKSGLSPGEEEEDAEEAELSDESVVLAALDSNGQWPAIRPGIVHRLDKGTTGGAELPYLPLNIASLSVEFQYCRASCRDLWASICRGGKSRINKTRGICCAHAEDA